MIVRAKSIDGHVQNCLRSVCDTARFDGRQTFVYAILKHSALFNAIRLLNLFHHNTKIPERNILCSITTKLTIRATSKTHATLTSPLVRIKLYMVVPPIACDRTTIRAWSHHQSFVIVCQAVARSVVRPVTSCSDWLHDQTVMLHTISICNRWPRLVVRESVRFLKIGEDERYDQSWLIVRLVVAINDQSYHQS